jgi:hypothetical protein
MIKAYLKRKRRERLTAPRQESMFSKIYERIEREYHLAPFQTTNEIDGVYGEYMEVMLIFGFLCCFGNVFPLGKIFFENF